jgi:hypothetical protein
MWTTEMLRQRMNADVAVFADSHLSEALPAGVVTRGALWEACDSAANPAVTEMTGAQLADLVDRGAVPEFMAEKLRPLRGRERGRLNLAGIERGEIDSTRTYVVAGTDWELDTYAGYALPEWGLRVRYDMPIIVREAIAEHLAG